MTPGLDAFPTWDIAWRAFVILACGGYGWRVGRDFSTAAVTAACRDLADAFKRGYRRGRGFTEGDPLNVPLQCRAWDDGLNSEGCTNVFCDDLRLTVCDNIPGPVAKRIVERWNGGLK